MSKFDRLLNENSPLLSTLTRRQFLKVSFAAFVAATLSKVGLTAAFQNATMPNGVAAGEVTQSGAVLWTHSTALGPLTFEYTTADNFETILGSLMAEVTDVMQPVKVEITALMPATDYFYRVTDSAGNIGLGRFRTAAPLGTFAGLRFGVTGDWRGELAPYPSISNVVERDLEFFAGLGDTIYADFPSPDLEKPRAETLAEFRIKHNEGYSARFDVNHWAAIRANTPFIPSIDDHEVVNDFAGGAPKSSNERFANFNGEFVNDTEYYRDGLQAFFEYNPIRNETWGETGDPVTANKPKLYRYFTYGSDAALFVLDNRSFRSTPLEPISDFEELGNVLEFLADTFDDTRSMLGMPQFTTLLRDLSDAHAKGITWKFVLMPEPIQNLGVVAAQDRFEGYTAERTALLKYIAAKGITNVVFIAADIHGTIVNNLTYQDRVLGPQIPTPSFEISTGSVAFDAPFGFTVIDLGVTFGLLDSEQAAAYRNGSREEKEALVVALLNAQIQPLGYPTIGLSNEDGIDATLLQGGWTATSTFGWTEFEIEANTQQLTVTTYGIDRYSRADIFANPEAILGRTPTIVQQFVVNPAHSV